MCTGVTKIWQRYAIMLVPLAVSMLGLPLAFIAGSAPYLATAALLGPILVLLDRLFRAPSTGLISVFVRGCAGVLCSSISGNAPGMKLLLAASLLSGGTSALSQYAFGHRLAFSTVCGSCESRVLFHQACMCPRCGRTICLEKCWIGRRNRCCQCEERAIRVLPTNSEWWTKHFGNKAAEGRCRLCLATADKMDLRYCRRCRWPACVVCWDDELGMCSSCGWVIPDELATRFQKSLGISSTLGN